MGHVPHLYLPGPWPGERIPLGEDHRRHLERVLRAAEGDPVTYTDGAGTEGEGVLSGGEVVRGEERDHPRPRPAVSVAVAPPKRKDRRRFLVEKLVELGVDRILWLETRYGEGWVPREDRAEAWAAAALEQSRGVWRTEVVPAGRLAELSGPVWVAEAGAPPPPVPEGDVMVAVGPEGGWHPEEIPAGALRIGLGSRVLRVETAALVAAVLILDRADRHGKW